MSQRISPNKRYERSISKYSFFVHMWKWSDSRGEINAEDKTSVLLSRNYCDHNLNFLLIIGSHIFFVVHFYDWCFPDRILNVTFDGALMLLQHDSSKNSKVNKKE
jgi:hypothetical protein